MNTEMVVLRLVHILLGTFWAGAVFFFVIFLEPSVRAAGPDGAKVMIGLKDRRWLDVLPALGLLTILAGLRMYWVLSSGLSAVWIHSTSGMTYTLGGIAALVAIGIGLFVVRAGSLRVFALMPAAMQAPEGPERAALQAQVGALRGRITAGARVVAVLLAFAVGCMAIARYV